MFEPSPTPCRSEEVDGGEPVTPLRVDGLLHHGTGGCGPAELVSTLGEPGREVPDQATKGVDGGALVDACAELELLRRHEAAGAEHHAHGVQEGSTSVGVKVDHGDSGGVEVDQKASVIEVAGDPAAFGQVVMQVDDAVEMAQQLASSKVGEALVGGVRLRLAVSRAVDEVTPGVVVDQRWSVGRFDHVPEPSEAGVTTGPCQIDGIAQQPYPSSVVEIGDRNSGRRWSRRPGGFHEEVAVVSLHDPGDVAGILGSMIELVDDPATSADQGLR